jgi:hypothetical protein
MVEEASHSGRSLTDHPARDLLDLFKDCSMSALSIGCQIRLLGWLEEAMVLAAIEASIQ